MEGAKKKIMETSSASKSIAELLAVFVNEIMPYFTDSGGSNNIKKIAAFTNNKAWNDYQENIRFLLKDHGFFLQLENIIHKFEQIFVGWEVKDLNIVKDKILAIKDSISGLQGGLSEFVKIIPFLTDKNNIDAFKKLNEGKPENSVLYLMTKAIIDQIAGPIMKSGYTPDKLSESLKVMTALIDIVSKLKTISTEFSEVLKGNALEEITKFIGDIKTPTGGKPIGDNLVNLFEYFKNNLLSAVDKVDISDVESSIYKMNTFTEMIGSTINFLSKFNEFIEKTNSDTSLKVVYGNTTKIEKTGMKLNTILEKFNEGGEIHQALMGLVGGMGSIMTNLFYPFAKVLNEAIPDLGDFQSAVAIIESVAELSEALSKFSTGFGSFIATVEKMPEIPADLNAKFTKSLQSVVGLTTMQIGGLSVAAYLEKQNPEMEKLANEMNIFASYLSEIKDSYKNIIDDVNEIGKTNISEEILKTLNSNMQIFGKINNPTVPATGVTQVPATANVFADEATRKRFAASATNTTQTAAVPADPKSQLMANNKQAAVNNAATTPAGAAVVQEENSEPILDTLKNISESINSFLAAAARGGGRAVTAGSNVPFIDRIGVDPKLGKRMNGDFAAGDGVNGTYTG
jgi:hypothetical protein